MLLESPIAWRTMQAFFLGCRRGTRVQRIISRNSLLSQFPDEMSSRKFTNYARHCLKVPPHSDPQQCKLLLNIPGRERPKKILEIKGKYCKIAFAK